MTVPPHPAPPPRPHRRTSQSNSAGAAHAAGMARVEGTTGSEKSPATIPKISTGAPTASDGVDQRNPAQAADPVTECRQQPHSGSIRAVAYAEFFAVQPTSSSALPNPIPLLENLARSAIEVLAGARELDQLSRWLSDEVYATLLRRVIIASRARRARGVSASRPSITVGHTRSFEPRDGVVEGVVIIHCKARTRAVAIRLEGFDNRWRASALHIL